MVHLSISTVTSLSIVCHFDSTVELTTTVCTENMCLEFTSDGVMVICNCNQLLIYVIGQLVVGNRIWFLKILPQSCSESFFLCFFFFFFFFFYIKVCTHVQDIQ